MNLRHLGATVSDRARSPYTWWLVAIVSVLLAVLLATSLDRFLEWDEAVFYSQSGGFRGTDPPQMPLVASREGGPGFLILMLRITGMGLVGVRVAWVLIALAIVGLAAFRLSRHFGPALGPLTFFVFGMSWLTLAYLGSFYGSLLNGTLLLLTSVLVIDLMAETGASARTMRIGAWIGLAAGLAFWLRQAESLLGVGVVVAVSVVLERGSLWRRHARSLLVAAGVFAISFIVPWLVWTSTEFGGVLERFDAVERQMAGNRPLSITNGLPEYLRALSGTWRAYGLFDEIPTWPGVVQIGATFVLVVVVALMLADRNTGPVQRSGIVLLTAQVLTLLGFFALYYASVEVRERYLANLVPMLAALAGIAVVWVARRVSRGFGSLALRYAVVAVGLVWVAAQMAVAMPFQKARVADTEASLMTGTAIRVLTHDQACEGVSRYGRPQLQLASGCRVQGALSAVDAHALAASFESGDRDAFILWPERLDLGSGWLIVDRSDEAGISFLHYWSPSGP